jgi:flagellar basal-body rod protein FlgG
MTAQQAWLDALSNDIANVNTDGYKQVRVAFRDLAYAEERGVQIGAGATTVDGGRSFAQGPLEETGERMHFAIDGPGFFQVRRADGQLALTRSGIFALDAQGAVVTANGERLFPPITVPKGVTSDQVDVAADGTLSVARRPVGRIALVDVPAHSGLLPVGGNLFLATAESGAPTQMREPRMRQGFVERSNVDIADAMVDMVQAQRGFELQSRVIKVQDQLLEIANSVRR